MRKAVVTRYETITLLMLSLFVLFSLISENLETPTGAATSVSTTSSAVIYSYFAITGSSNLTGGILFNITSLPATNINATANWALAGTNSQYFINVSTDSNVNVDICTGANDSLSSGANKILIANYTWSNATVNNATHPMPPLVLGTTATNYTTSNVTGITNLAGGSASYFRFWLSANAATPAGTYANTIYFKTAQTGSSCA